MLKFVLYRKELEILRIAKDNIIKTAADNDIPQGFGASIQELFFESNTNLRADFLELIPVNRLEKTRILLSFLMSINSTGGNVISSLYGGSKTINAAVNEITELEKLIAEETKKRMNFSVFYSWQSDSEQKYNRNFIEDCLEKAIKNINNSSSDGLMLSVDKDTRGVPGSPDIVNAILQKIDRAVCFVADVTPICIINEKGISNPNVMFELGYTLSSLEADRIILLCNTAESNLRSLPFDLGLKRVMTYKYNQNTSDEEKKICKENLIRSLTKAINDIVVR